MSERTSYAVEDGIATITLDDGKVNALSTAMLTEIGERLDQAESDAAVVVLTGRQTTFTAGFDLRCEPDGWPAMLAGGARLAERLLAFPHPVVAACNGNAIAMGAFVLLSCDHRVGAEGGHRIGLNEVAIGLTLPWFGVEIARHRLARPYFDRCTITGQFLEPAEAQVAGFLDAVVPAGDVLPRALAAAATLREVDRTAHAATKLKVREQVLAGVRDGIERIESGDVQRW